MKTVPDYVYQYLSDSLEVSIGRAKSIPESPTKESILTKLEEALYMTNELRGRDNIDKAI